MSRISGYTGEVSFSTGPTSIVAELTFFDIFETTVLLETNVQHSAGGTNKGTTRITGRTDARAVVIAICDTTWTFSQLRSGTAFTGMVLDYNGSIPWTMNAGFVQASRNQSPMDGPARCTLTFVLNQQDLSSNFSW